MHFNVKQGPFREEYLVEAVEPKAGNDAALIAVFSSEIAARSLADMLNGVAEALHRLESLSK